jgi:hypothetical protein
VDLRAGVDDLEKRKFLTLPGLELQPVASRYTDYAIPAPDGASVQILCFWTLSIVLFYLHHCPVYNSKQRFGD